VLIPFEAPKGFDPATDFPYVRFSPTGRRVVVATEHGRWACVVDIPSQKQVHRLVQPGPIRAHFLADDRLLFQHDAGLTAYDLARRREVWSEPELCGWGAWVNPRCNRVVVGRYGVGFYDLKTRKRVRTFGPCIRGKVLSGEFSPDGRLFALDLFQQNEVSDQRYIQLWEVRREPLCRLLEVEKRGDGDQGVMAFSPDNRLLAVSVESGVLLFDVTKGKRLRDVNGGPVVAHGIRFSSSGRSLEIASYDGTVYRATVKTGRVRRRFPAPEGCEVGACAVNDRGLAAGVLSAAVLFWQLPEWEEP
jgi:WD40 repeat protein